MDTLPSFPAFRPISLADYTWYSEIYARFKPYADFSFGNLMIWLNQRDDLSLSQLHNNIILRCTNVYMDDRVMFNILGNSFVDKTIQSIFDFQHQNNMEQELLGVPDFTIKEIVEPNKLRITEDPENDEYVMSASFLAQLDGSLARNLRRDINSYERHTPEPIEIHELNLSNRDVATSLQNELRHWDKAFSGNETASQEIPVIERTFKLAKELHYGGMCINIKGKMAGFILYQRLPHHNVVAINHLKTNHLYGDTSLYLTHELARSLARAGIKYMNFEQDLGIPGLRTFKLKLRPHHMLKKYNVTPALTLQN
ncbi:MAG TPA: phosphatidylglycerol lysyltransferase domain-containing protein [Candidatus Saccharimonadia bacterium]|nr:phosphatidylglycerol lysyltransferase domain-containing protein [Candidatus Saccharimonadia bacterium]